MELVTLFCRFVYDPQATLTNRSDLNASERRCCSITPEVTWLGGAWGRSMPWPGREDPLGICLENVFPGVYFFFHNPQGPRQVIEI